MESIHEILKERGTRYGEFRTHAKITQLLKGAVGQEQGYLRLSLSQREAMDMILHKIGRIVNGDPNYIDSWVDICGYSQLVVDELKAEEEFQNTGKIVPCDNPKGHPLNCEHSTKAQALDYMLGHKR